MEWRLGWGRARSAHLRASRRLRCRGPRRGRRYGSYEILKGGNISEALVDLTVRCCMAAWRHAHLPGADISTPHYAGWGQGAPVEDYNLHSKPVAAMAASGALWTRLMRA